MFLFYYLSIINIVTFAAFGTDKWKAIKGKWRISERMLMGMTAIGGSVGAWIAMQVFRHKIHHKKFYLGVPVLMFLQMIAIVAIWIE